jgi:hypothetical protein
VVVSGLCVVDLFKIVVVCCLLVVVLCKLVVVSGWIAVAVVVNRVC